MFYATYMRFIYVRRVIYFSINKSLFGRFEVLTAVVMKSTIFWDMTPCSPLKFTRYFVRTCRLLLQGRISQARYQRESRWQAEALRYIPKHCFSSSGIRRPRIRHPPVGGALKSTGSKVDNTRRRMQTFVVPCYIIVFDFHSFHLTSVFQKEFPISNMIKLCSVNRKQADKTVMPLHNICDKNSFYI
jgi:hypothetical protein